MKLRLVFDGLFVRRHSNDNHQDYYGWWDLHINDSLEYHYGSRKDVFSAIRTMAMLGHSHLPDDSGHIAVQLNRERERERQERLTR